MLVIALLLAGALFVAYANGANDNFKGVATLYGSGTVGYRGALAWATLTTLAGSLCSVLLAGDLVEAFSAKGLVPDAVAQNPEFVAAVALGAATTVFLATMTGFPISTTHALTGALMGAGLVSVGFALNLSLLGKTFFLPLIASPLLAIALGSMSYPLFRRPSIDSEEPEEACVCLVLAKPAVASGALLSASAAPALAVALDTETNCARRFPGRLLGARLPSFLDGAHFLSAGALSFARGLNDTPKIVGLLIVLQALQARVSLLLIALVMAIGGLLQARRVAWTMSRRITRMNDREALAANLVTSILVLTASHSGLPVSTTHVSCGSLFGMGLVTRQANLPAIRNIVASWVITLPAATLFAGAFLLVLNLSG